MLVDGDHPIALGPDPTLLEIADIGDFRIAHGDIEGTLAAIEVQAKPLNHLVALGGYNDHARAIAGAGARIGPVGAGAFRRPCRYLAGQFRAAFRPRFAVLSCDRRRLIDPHCTVQIGIRRRCRGRV